MTMLVLALLAQGMALAAVFALLARWAGPRRAPRMHAALLVGAGPVYVCFALAAGSRSGLLVELTGTALLLAVAACGLRRRSAAALALGWALHPVWDVALHTGGAGSYAPFGYVVTCLGFDLLLAALLVRGGAGMPAHARTGSTTTFREA